MSSVDSAPSAEEEWENEEAADGDVQTALSAERERLASVRKGIDCRLKKIDRLRGKIAKAEINIAHKEQEITLLKTLRRKQSTDAPFRTSCPMFDRRCLNAEHQNFVDEFLDRIYELECALEKQERTNRDLSDDYDALVHENEELRRGIRTAKVRIERAAQEACCVADQISRTQRRLREQKVHIRSNARILSDVEAAASGLIERGRDIEDNAGNILELQNRVRSTADEIAMEQSEIDRLNKEIDAMEEDTTAAVEDINNEISQIRQVANCEDETARINAEIQKTTTNLGEIQLKNKAGDKRYNTLYRRYRQLKPIIDKWARDDLTRFEPIESIEALLAGCTKAVQTTSTEYDRLTKRLETVMIENSTTEMLIKKKREELERAIALFRIETVKLKEQIDAKRLNSFEMEHELVTQIGNLKVKIAQRHIKK
jgi:chromosome segregation ATPase